jgi:16S rRNA (cytidine1402-2'-O)-methyltransferase
MPQRSLSKPLTPTLYIVGTPIGNLEDVTLRALRILENVGLIAAEDTRTTRKLLTRHSIRTPLTSFHDRNSVQKVAVILNTLEREDVALVSDAGMPNISDPGYDLVVSALAKNVPVVAVPGPSAVTTAVTVSALAGPSFLFLGFLPRRRIARLQVLDRVKNQNDRIVIFEAPHRLSASLQDVLSALGNRRVAVCRELTKLHEEVFRGRVDEAMNHFREPRGEFTLVLEGAGPPNKNGEDARDLLLAQQSQGLRAREAVANVVAATGLPRREVYRLWLELLN